MSKLTQSRQCGDSQIHLGRWLLMIMVMPNPFLEEDRKNDSRS